MNDKSSSKYSENLEHITKIILIVGIIIVSSALVYVSTRPKEEFALCYLLNENQQIGNYRTNTSINTPYFFYVSIDNQYLSSQSFQVKVFLGNNESVLNPKTGISNAKLGFTVNHTLSSGEIWISEKLNVSFSSVGDDQILAIELWRLVDGDYQYQENYLLFIHIDVLDNK